jgi:hypothetical protein
MFLGVAALAACAPAQMRLSDTFAAAERIEFAGIDGWERGDFRAGDYTGGYERSAERISFNVVKENRGHSAFVIEGPEISSTIEGYCRMREGSLDLGIVEVIDRKMAYRCEFTAEGRPIPAYLELQESHANVLRPYARRGEIALGGEVVQVRSVHEIVGGKLPTGTPIGYVFEQDGHDVGAVELNGRPALIVPVGTDPGLRRTLTVAALALGVFWDPANSPDG